MTRQEWVERITSVRHVAQTYGRERKNPPSLGQIREFVAMCDGLPDDTHVNIEKGQLDEGGRHSMTFSVRLVEREESRQAGPANQAAPR